MWFPLLLDEVKCKKKDVCVNIWKGVNFFQRKKKLSLLSNMYFLKFSAHKICFIWLNLMLQHQNSFLLSWHTFLKLRWHVTNLSLIMCSFYTYFHSVVTSYLFLPLCNSRLSKMSSLSRILLIAIFKTSHKWSFLLGIT